jgi:catechol 2,3-dioxygenase-like lactoylglutathione lyase family enzyme
MEAEKYTFDHVAQVVPDIAAAVDWYRETLPGVTVLYQDATWALVEAGGVKLAFVVRDQHPGHLAWRVADAELERLAARHSKEIKPHRDGTRSFYLEAPGGQNIEIISYGSSAPAPSD